MNKGLKIYVAGHLGMVGSAIMRRLTAEGFSNLITRTREELDLLDQRKVFEFLASERLDYVFVAAAKVGGIHANNTYRAEFIYENLAIATNLIHGAHLANVQNLMFLGSSCIYPRDCPQPMREEYLLTGSLEPTNEPYAVAKIAGIKLCEAYRAQYQRQYWSVLPTNLYGPGDSYDLNESHVIPALIMKAEAARTTKAADFEVWGTGNPMREFLHVDDLAAACLLLSESGQGPTLELVNVGSGETVSIRELAGLVAAAVGFNGGIRFNAAMPDGAAVKSLDSSRLRALGWSPRFTVRTGLADLAADYRAKNCR